MKPVTLDRPTAKRLIRNSKYLDQKPRNKVPPPQTPLIYTGGTIMLTTTTLPRGSAATPGKGMGKIQQFNGTSYSDASTAVYPILNLHTALIASGAYVIVVPACGYFHFVTTACANVTP